MKKYVKANMYETDSLSQIQMDMLELNKRLTYQIDNSSTDEQENSIRQAIIYIRKAYNAIRL